MNELSIPRLLFRISIITLACLGGVWWQFGRTAAEKIATSLALPYGLIWYLLTCGLLISASFRYRRVFWTLLTVWSMYSVLGNGFVATWVCQSLEAPMYDIQPLQQEPFDVVIVLGGGAATGGNGRIQGNTSGDRLILAAQLYHAGIAPQIICTGTRIESMTTTDVDPSQQSATVLVGLGVPESAIETVGGGTTAEEMQTLGQRFSSGDERIGLVTSAWHLPRALRLAERNGLKPQPLPADFMSSRPPQRTPAESIQMMIPQVDAAYAISRCFKEYLGMLVGR